MSGSTTTASAASAKALRRPTRRERWRDGRRPYVICATFMGVLLTACLWIMLFPPTHGPAGDGTPPGQAVAKTPTVDVMPSPAVTCAAQASVDLAPEQIAAASYITTWYPVGTMSAPSSAAAGPGQARRCFARTPEGALYAGVTRMVEEAASTGLTQEAAAKGVTDIHFDGYQWLSWSPDRAVLVVRVAASNSVETRHVARVLDITWADNDWAEVPDDSTAAGQAAADPKRVFTPWGDS